MEPGGPGIRGQQLTPCTMTQFPVFSIVIPTYNRAARILGTLQSIWQQTYSHYEVIVVDDCSTDYTVEVLEPYIRTQRIKFIQHHRNFERSRSRNTGMNAATGDFLTFLDSDDLMYPRNLEDAAEYVSSHPESQCFHNLFEFIDDRGKVVYRPRFPVVKNQIRSIAQGNFMSCIGNFIHREVYTQFRFSTDPEIICGEDWDFWLRVLAKHKLGRIEKINNGAVQHEGRSVNRQNIRNVERGLQRLVQNLVEDPELARVYAPHLKTIEATSMIYLAILANSSGASKTALSYLYSAAKKDLSILRTPGFLRASQIAVKGLLQADQRRLKQSHADSVREHEES